MTLQRVLFLSQKAAEAMSGDPGVAVISITDPDKPEAELHPGWGAALRLAFHDSDPLTFPGMNLDMISMHEAQGRCISGFLETLPPGVRTLVVHCRAGISRSAAVAKAVADTLGLPFDADYKDFNRHVYAVTRQALGAPAARAGKLDNANTAEAEGTTPAPLYRRAWESRELLARHRPRHSHPNKSLLFDMALGDDGTMGSMVTLSRWPAWPLPALLNRPLSEFQIEAVPGHFEYGPSSHPEDMDWHLNFADLDAFATWRSPLFAQDEIQVAEHPVLAALHLLSREQDISMRTVDEEGGDDSPTPVLVCGAERRVAVETSKSGLYGNAFQRAAPDEVIRATRVINPPSLSNILAIQAPLPGRGCYGADVIREVLQTAFSGASAAVRESRLQQGPDALAVIHTGFWGCGAYGGNRTLMVLLQMLAAHLAGVRRIVFHTGGASGHEPYEKALEIYRRISVQPPDTPLEAVVTCLEEMSFPWGVSDGN